MYEDYKDQGLMVLGIGAGQSQAACQNWINTHGITHPVLSDASSTIYTLFGDGFVPYNAIMDCDDIVLYTIAGFNETAVRSTIVTALEDVIQMQHTPQHDIEDIMTPVTIDATVQAGSAFVAGFPKLFYRTNGGMWTSVEMMNTSGYDYSADIPGQASDTTVDYYIEAQQENGCSRVLPLPNEYYSFFIGPDSVFPEIDHTYLSQISENMLPFIVSADVIDNLGVQSVSVEYQVNGGGYSTLPMTMSDAGYQVEIPDSLTIGDMIQYRIIAVDQATLPNTAYDPTSGYYTTEVIDLIPAIVIDLDGAHNSGTIIRNTIQTLLGSCAYVTAMPASLNIYRTAFVCLGVYGASSHTLNGTESSVLEAMMDAGGNVYMEGGDTWAYDPRTDAHAYFNIIGVTDGVSDAGPYMLGKTGTFTAGMNLAYNIGSSYNNYIDHLNPTGGSYSILENDSPVYNTMIAYDSGTYKTIGSSIKFGGLSNGSTQLTTFMNAVLTFFGIAPEPTPTPIPTATPTENPCVNNGDANLDDDLTAGDAQTAFYIVLGLVTPTTEQECAADCNGDQEVTAGDAQNIFLAVLGTGACVDPL
ncbi:redoxin domain-containing protein [bacterium]|nr:redoxin domain-containing protein [candidate division CSSED10-310 bacterium]